MIHIKRNDWKQAELTIGIGENRFRMNRGSFVYCKRITRKIKLRTSRVENLNDGILVFFANAAGTELYRLLLTDGKDTGSTGENYQVELIEIEKGIKALANSSGGKKFNQFWLKVPTSDTEHIYGCGETYSKLDLKGEKMRIWVAEHQNANRIGRKLIKEKILGKHPNQTLPFNKYESYYAQPTYTSSEKYYVHADLSRYGEFDFRQRDSVTFYTQELPKFFVESGETFEEVSEKLSKRLGRVRTLPDWIYDGAILAVQEGTERIEEKLQKAAEHGVKVCGVWSQDWCGCRKTGFGYQVMWNWEWDRDLYSNLDQKISEWKTKGIRFLGYINPFIALEKNLYQIASEKGYCVKDKEGKDYLVTITTFPAAMVDFTNPEAYAWYKEIIKKNMIDLGLGGWMADFGEYLPVDAVLYSGEDPEEVHNRWPAIWAKMNQEAIAERGKEGEVFFFTRAGHTGTIAASAMMWTGDQHVDFSVDDGLPSVIPATLSLAMSGYPIAHSDVGGYTTVMHMTRSKELLMRWEEMNAFSPLFRFHEGNQPSRNVQFDEDEELLAQLKRTTDWHVALKPYLRKLEQEAVTLGTPVMRPLFYHYDMEEAYGEKTEYLLGRDLLVAPVLEEQKTHREVFLPGETWVHLLTGREYQSGVVNVHAPIGCPPVFVRKEVLKDWEFWGNNKKESMGLHE